MTNTGSTLGKVYLKAAHQLKENPNKEINVFNIQIKPACKRQQQLQLITLVASSICLHLLQNPISSTETAYFGEIAISSYTEKIILIEKKKKNKNQAVRSRNVLDQTGPQKNPE